MMHKRVNKVVWIFVLVLVLPNCGGTKNSTNAGLDGDTTLQEEFSSGVEFLQAADFENARDQFDATAAAAQAQLDAMSSNQQALIQSQTAEQLLALLANSQFGGALTRHALLIDSLPSQAMQAQLDLQNSEGSAVLTLDDLIGAGSYLDQLAEYKIDPSQGKPGMSGIPFSGSLLPGSSFIAQVLHRARNDLVGSDLQSEVRNLQPLSEEIIRLLTAAATYTDFSFTIPKEIYSGNEDIEVSRADLYYYLGSVQFQRSLLSFMNVWNFDIDLGTIYNADGTFAKSKDEIVLEMNENFFNTVNATELSEAKLFLAGSMSSFLSGLNNTPVEEGFGNIEESEVTEDLFADFTNIIIAVQSSFDGEVAIPTGAPAIMLNLGHFFDAPPTSDEIGIDPFVHEGGQIKFVEAFFNELIEDTLIGITFPMNSFRLLKDTILSSSDITDAIFDELKEFGPFTDPNPAANQDIEVIDTEEVPS